MSNIFTAVCTVVRDAEVRYLPSGAAVLNVTVANNIGYGDKQKTLFIRCALFGKRAEGSLKDYLLKGQQVMISGELSENEYQANDGTTKKSLELNANILDLVGGRKDSDQSNSRLSNQGQQTANRNPSTSQRDMVTRQPDNFDAAYDDDIPFASLNWQIRAHLI